MTTPAKIVASALSKNSTSATGKNLAIYYVTETDSWKRLFIAEDTKQEFIDVVEANKSQLSPNTALVGMK